jgi:hypothetical protein
LDRYESGKSPNWIEIVEYIQELWYDNFYNVFQ